MRYTKFEFVFSGLVCFWFCYVSGAKRKTSENFVYFFFVWICHFLFYAVYVYLCVCVYYFGASIYDLFSSNFEKMCAC